jgi:hypothetical protein
MTDPTPDATPDATPAPATPPTPPPAYSAPPAAYAPPAGGGKQALSLTSFILGLAGFVFGWVPVLGLVVAVAAVVLGFLGRAKEPGAPKWMWIVGLILGFLGILFGLVYIILFFIGLSIASTGNYTGY